MSQMLWWELMKLQSFWLVVKILGKIAQVGDTVDIKEQGLTFTVQKVEGARITRLVIQKDKAVSEEDK